jgi:hypothetical protein
MASYGSNVPAHDGRRVWSTSGIVTGKGKQKYLKKAVSCHFVCHKPCMVATNCQGYGIFNTMIYNVALFRTHTGTQSLSRQMAGREVFLKCDKNACCAPSDLKLEETITISQMNGSK